MASSRLALYFRGEGLADKDTLSKSDPYIVVSAVAGNARSPVGRTETVQDDLNPAFTKAVHVDYVFETRQEFLLEVYDDDGKGPGQDDSLGRATFQLAHVVGSRGSTLKVALSKGAIFVTAKEEGAMGRDTVVLQFRGSNLKKMDLFGKSDPYFKLSTVLPNGTTRLAHKTKAIDNTLDPAWPALPQLSVAQLAAGDAEARNIRFECFDKDMFSDDSMGEFTASLNELIGSHQNRQPFVLKDKKGNTYGNIFVERCDIRHVPSFVDYLRGGLQINLAVSVDFTGSNGDPRNPRSLHYMDPVQPNQYVRAIMSVCDILMEYDTDKMVPAFGFGAQDPVPGYQIHHLFHLNGQQDPHVHGVQGILDAYGQALRTMRLAGPTNFAPTIEAARQIACGAENTYTVLLILTDGEITDMDRTIDAIVGCDRTPLSIIIVGVGNGCDFAMMDQLDADGQRLRGSNGHVMSRDIVQFVPFRNFVNAPPGALAAEVLREVPTQAVDWAIAAGVQ